MNLLNPSVLRNFRKSANLTQEDMAEELNITQSHVSKYESGRKILDHETLARWIQITNCEVHAALVMFGAEICAQAAQLATLAPAFSIGVGRLLFIM
ncbi:helix-turn-helix transcriptional regulator [Solibacillus sp. CAU 1738]|uniref:helix-turn-helix domain-containing protein n=1 Tax=Solibacillus sp. CAU 1738 TaxID=3140363 RepID=UPI003260C8E4